MDVVVIFNGLGNQMSQYAFFLAKKEQTSNCVAMYDKRSRKQHNGFELKNIFNIKTVDGFEYLILQIFYDLLRIHRLAKFRPVLDFLGVRIVKEAANYDFNPSLLKPGKRGINFYFGGWHSEKNFISIQNEIRNVFQFPVIDDPVCLNIKRIIEKAENSVSLHIRRGDYLNIKDDDFYQLNGVATLEYYKKAIERINQDSKDCVFFIFSNDIEWCKSEFSELNVYYVTCNQGNNSWRDMYLMSLCKHHINANSTFSWWGAWLSEKQGITICPKKFIRTIETRDFYPDSWIKI